MRHTFIPSLFAALIASSPMAAVRAVGPVDLIKYVPQPVNTIAVINVRAILESPRAVREGWAKKDHTEFLAGAVPVHPSVERILLAKELSVDAPGRGGALAVIPLKKSLDVGQFATSRGGHTDTLADETIAVTSDGTVGVKLADQLLGLIRTDSRQDVARWVRYAKGSVSSQQSRYLNNVVSFSGARHHVFVGVDTGDLFHPKQIEQAVAVSEALKADPATAAAVGAFFSRLNGLRFAANLTGDGIRAEVWLDTGAPARVDPGAVKAFLAEVMSRNGAELEDMRAATARAEVNSIILAFRMSDPELARVMALMAVPVQGVSDAETVSVAPTGTNSATTIRYYRAVNKVLDDMKVKFKNATDYEKTALWHDTAANQIESLSVLNVDPRVVEFGLNSAYRMRLIGDSLRGVPIQAAAVSKDAYLYASAPPTMLWLPRGGLRLNPWAFAGQQSVVTNLPEIRAREAAIIKADTEKRNQIWESIDQQRSAVRPTGQ